MGREGCADELLGRRIPQLQRAVASGFTGTVSAVALLARNPDGSCSLTQVPRHEVDKFAESRTLSF
jgi:hypothetical protein